MSKQPVSREVVAKAFADSSLFSDFLEPFPNLLGGRRSGLDASFKRIAQAMSKSKRHAAVQFTIATRSKPRHWCVLLHPKGAEVSDGAIEQPSLEIITDTECWTQIASGSLSPLEAFGQGRLRVRGSIELARSIARQLRS